jgi:hypothetical protein
MAKNFTEKQREILARRLGYNGPMERFEDFVRSDPALERKYSAVVQKLQKGGYVQKFQTGGTPTAPDEPTVTASQIAQPTTTSGQLVTATSAPTTATTVTAAPAPTTTTATQEQQKAAAQVTAATAQPGVTTALTGLTPQQGTVSTQAQVTGQTGTVSPASLAEVQQVSNQFIQQVQPAVRTTQSNELITAATDQQAPAAELAQMGSPTPVQGITRTISAAELVTPAQIREADMAQAKDIVDAGLSPDAKAVAARLNAFSVDAGTLAQAEQGNVDALATVEGQLRLLMRSFDDGTPAWAAGAIRAANSAMASRGLGSSSIAAAAVFQAAMESALPIAAQDAQTFANMGLANLNNRQQVALANAAAQQGLQLQNLNNEQQTALQNSANAFALQSQNLSNRQQTALANAQIRAALQGQNLTNQQQAAVVNAERFAEVANINLNNLQQAALQSSAQQLQADIANLSAKQQTYIANAQLQSALQLKNLDNRQQAAVLNAATISDAFNLSFNAAQQAALHNSTLMQTVGVANLNARQATVLANAATVASMDMANLNNRQQAAVVNAQAFLQMDLTNLNNRQQTALFKSQEMINAIMSDTAAQNAARQFNASSVNQVNQFYDSLSSQVKQFNAAQTNAMAQFNVEQRNAIGQFNANVQNQRDQFNAENRRIIDQSNAEWRRNIATANTAAINRANEFNATSALQVTMAEYNNLWQKYRDDIEYSWKTGENELDRENELAKQVLQKQATIEAAQFQVEAAKYSALGTLAATLLDKSGGAATVGAIISGAASALWGAAGSMGSSIISGFKTVRTKLAEGANPDTLPKFTGPVTGTVKVQIPLPFGGTETKSFSNEYLDFIADTYKQPKGTQIHAMLAEQDSWFYD